MTLSISTPVIAAQRALTRSSSTVSRPRGSPVNSHSSPKPNTPAHANMITRASMRRVAHAAKLAASASGWPNVTVTAEPG